MSNARVYPPLVEPGPPLTDQQLSRWARHLPLPGVGGVGQRRLANARVGVVGAGGLGSPILQYLAAAGVGHISVIDPDVVDLTNLQRQVLYTSEDVGQPKVHCAAKALNQLNPDLDVTAIQAPLDVTNAEQFFATHDLVLDGSDNFLTRYLANDAAEITGTPLVWGTIFQFVGQLSVFWPARGPMLRDIFPDIPEADSVPSCAISGVLGALPGVVGSAMALEALKLIMGLGMPAVGELILFDGLEGTQRKIHVSPDPKRVPVTSLDHYQTDQQTCSPLNPPINAAVKRTSPYQLKERLDSGDGSNQPFIVDVRNQIEPGSGAIPGAVHVPSSAIFAGGIQAIPGAQQALDDGRDVVLYCKAGMMSAKAASALATEVASKVGAENLKSSIQTLDGGILAWNGGPAAQ